MTGTTYLSCAETAKLVRAALKSNFPGVRFSVRSSTYAGGASIDVDWIDGPTTKEVDLAVAPYVGSTFDGMIDLKSPNPPVLMAGPDGVPKPTRFGSDFIFTHREYSPELWWAEAKKVAEKWGFDPTIAPPRISSSYRFPKRLVCSGLEEEGWKSLHVENAGDHVHGNFNHMVRRALEGRDW